ncbi:hypothetical protein L6452_29197 [Arctium lappa]|uniref:Uncharacterized protein n=1 Tax=Arctium lappa TaxID=4217 RepID=A0ACB8ZGF6_ARCLA|nr:hypothetical protein L6452_29197 [Arctium lappa]
MVDFPISFSMVTVSMVDFSIVQWPWSISSSYFLHGQFPNFVFHGDNPQNKSIHRIRRLSAHLLRALSTHVSVAASHNYQKKIPPVSTCFFLADQCCYFHELFQD